jgi:hypothetical protein
MSREPCNMCSTFHNELRHCEVLPIEENSTLMNERILVPVSVSLPTIPLSRCVALVAIGIGKLKICAAPHDKAQIQACSSLGRQQRFLGR